MRLISVVLLLVTATTVYCGVTRQQPGMGEFVLSTDDEGNELIATDEEKDAILEALGVREESMGKRSLAFGRANFRPGKRSLALGRNGFRPGKRSIALGRVGFRPGKRSLALGRNGFRPGKRSAYDYSEY